MSHLRYPDNYIPCKYCNDDGWTKHDPKYPSCYFHRNEAREEVKNETETKKEPKLF